MKKIVIMGVVMRKKKRKKRRKRRRKRRIRCEVQKHPLRAACRHLIKHKMVSIYAPTAADVNEFSVVTAEGLTMKIVAKTAPVRLGKHWRGQFTQACIQYLRKGIDTFGSLKIMRAPVVESNLHRAVAVDCMVHRLVTQMQKFTAVEDIELAAYTINRAVLVATNRCTENVLVVADLNDVKEHITKKTKAEPAKRKRAPAAGPRARARPRKDAPIKETKVLLEVENAGMVTEELETMSDGEEAISDTEK
jgi:hypothetical protein